MPKRAKAASKKENGMGSNYTQVAAVREMLEASERKRITVGNSTISIPVEKKKRSKISKWVRGEKK